MQKHVTNTRDMGKNGPRVFPRAHDPFCHLVKIPSLETRGDYSAPRDLECVSNRLARSTRDPGTSLAANTYRYIIIRDRLPPYRYTPHFSHGARWTLERNRRFIVLSRRGRELSRSERNAWSSLLRFICLGRNEAVHFSVENRPFCDELEANHCAMQISPTRRNYLPQNGTSEGIEFLE